jgi:hypothetical protein
VRATDSGSPGLPFDKQFVVTINNLNEAPSNISLSNSQVNENVTPPAAIGTLSATDQDSGKTQTFSLPSGGCGGGPFNDNSSFQISGSTLQSAVSFDFETKSSYTICVRTTDSGSPALSFDKQFIITINNVNDAPTNISLSGNGSINENQPSGTTIGTLTAADQDAGQTQTFTLPSNGCGGGPFNDNSSFAISGSSLRSAVSFDFETKSSYTICIRTTDSGSPALSFDKQFTIAINDVNDPPVAVTDTYTDPVGPGLDQPPPRAVGNTLAVRATTGSGPQLALTAANGQTGNTLIANDTDQDNHPGGTFNHALKLGRSSGRCSCSLRWRDVLAEGYRSPRHSKWVG